METHHPHHVTHKKKWTEYLLEFLMLFLAVFLGFVAENIREEYLEHKKAAEYASMLKMDLMNDTSQLQHLLSNKDLLLKLSVESEKKYDKPEDEITIGELRSGRNNSFELSYFIPNDATLSQLKSSGAFRYFKNPGLTNRLAIYESYIKKFYDTYHIGISIYGGLQSEHVLQHNIQLDKFLKQTSAFDSAESAKKAGYKFPSWNEYHEIVGGIIQVYNMQNEITYPELKKQATEIIKLLNKEYHLEK